MPPQFLQHIRRDVYPYLMLHSFKATRKHLTAIHPIRKVIEVVEPIEIPVYKAGQLIIFKKTLCRLFR